MEEKKQEGMIQEAAEATVAEEVAQEAAPEAVTQAAVQAAPRPTKFCSHCGGSIDEQAVVCPLCGCQVEQMAAATPNIVINNANTNTNTQVQKQTVAPVVVAPTHPKNKWVALLLCCLGFFGLAGIHKFYEGKVGMGVLYLLTCGLCGIGTVVDLITLLFKSNPYYV